MRAKYSIFFMNNAVMLCLVYQPSLIKNFDLSSVFPVDPVTYNMINNFFFLLKSAFIARHETRNFKLPWDIFGDYVNVTIGAAANIKISDAGHANFMPGMSPDMQGMPNPNGFTIGMPSMPNWMSKNWEWIISPARDLGPKFS